MTNDDHRHIKRINRMQALFAYSASHGQAASTRPDYLTQFQEHQAEIDQLIEKAAPEWPIDQMNQVDLAILRSVILESKIKKTPVKVLMNEAIEIAKYYGSESSPKFVNGVLGKVLVKSE